MSNKYVTIYKENPFKKVISAILTRVRSFFSKRKDYSDSNVHYEPKDFIQNIDKVEAPKENLEKLIEPLMIENLKISENFTDWTKQNKYYIGNKSVEYKEKLTTGERYACYLINGQEVMSKFENTKLKHNKMVDYYVDEVTMNKFGVPIKEYKRNPKRDSYLEEIQDKETGKKIEKRGGPILNLDEDDDTVIGTYETIEESDDYGNKFRFRKTKQKILDIETKEEHTIIEEHHNYDGIYSIAKQVDGKLVFREKSDSKTGKTTIELFDKEGKVKEIHEFDEKGNPIVTLDANGQKLTQKGYHMVDGKIENYEIPKPLRGMEKLPSKDKMIDFNDKQWNRYFKMLKKDVVNFNVPKLYILEEPMNSNTFEVIVKTKAKMKEDNIKENVADMNLEPLEDDGRS